MSDRTTDMTVGSPGRLIFVFSLPLCASGILKQITAAVVRMIVGRGCGTAALAAVGAASTGYYPLNWFLFGFSQGVCSVIGYYFGHGERRQLREAVSTAVVLSLVLGGGSSVLGASLAGPMLRLLNTPSDIFADAKLYLVFIAGGAFIETMYMIYSVALCALGDSRDPLIAIGIQSAGMILITLFLVFGLGLGAFSAALATDLAELAAALYCLFRLLRMQVLKPEAGDRRFSAACLKRMLSASTPLGFQIGATSIGAILMQRALNGYGSVTIAAYAAAYSLGTIVAGIENAYSSVMTSYVSQNRGAQRYDRIRRGLRDAVLIGIGISVCAAAVMLLGGRALLGLYIRPSAPEAGEETEIALRFLRILSFCPIFLFLLHACRGSLFGLGRSAATLPGCIAEIAGRSLTPTLFTTVFGWPSIFFAEASAWALGGLTHLTLFLLCMRHLPKDGPAEERSR